METIPYWKYIKSPVACVCNRGTDGGVGVILTANIVSVKAVVCPVSAAFVVSRTPVFDAIIAVLVITLSMVSTDISHHHSLTHLELDRLACLKSLDEGVHLCVAMTPSLSKAEACSNKEQGKS